MKKSYFVANLSLIRSLWGLDRPQMGKLLHCSSNTIGNYERKTTSIPPDVIFTLSDLTGVPPHRLYYEALTRSSFPIQPLSQSKTEESLAQNPTPQYEENLSLTERVRRLEMKVFGA